MFFFFCSDWFKHLGHLLAFGLHLNYNKLYKFSPSMRFRNYCLFHLVPIIYLTIYITGRFTSHMLTITILSFTNAFIQILIFWNFMYTCHLKMTIILFSNTYIFTPFKENPMMQWRICERRWGRYILLPWPFLIFF